MMTHSRAQSQQVPFNPLTERENDILKLLTEGRTDREIAARLVVAYTTVKWYNRQIFNKLGVSNRREAIELAENLELFAAADPEATPSHNLPAQTTPFVGRGRELADLSHLLAHPTSRLVTILAPGGMGKTRLALAAARQRLHLYRDGVFFVPLVALNNPDDIIPTLAQHVGYPFQRDQRSQQQQLLDYLSDKDMLLVLDNFEHVLDGAHLMNTLLEAAPRLQILVTSRERLNVKVETVYALESMSYPLEATERPLDYDAVQLFSQCAQHARPDYSLNNVDDVVRVCQLVKGMPLGIELAAAWLEVLSLQEIADEIALSLDFLSSRMRDIPERQRSVRAVYESSWRRLTDAERSAFMKLSVFRGGCTRRAALTVAGVGLQALSGLVDKALVTWLPGDERYITHELLRQYAGEALEKAGLAEAQRASHCAYYAEQMALRESDLKGADQVAALRDIAADLENVKAAFGWAVEREQHTLALQVMSSLGMFYYASGRIHEGLDFISALTSTLRNWHDAEARSLLGRVLAWMGIYWGFAWQHELAVPSLQEALAIAREQNDRWQIALCLPRLAIADQRMSPALVVQNCQESINICCELDDKYLMAFAYNSLGYFASPGDLDACQRWTLEAARLRRDIGDKVGLTRSLVNLSDHAQRCGWWEQAEQYSQECQTLCEELGDVLVMGVNLGNQVAQSLHKGDFDQAEARVQFGLQQANVIKDLANGQRFLFELSMLRLLQARYSEALSLAEQALDKGSLLTSDIQRFERGYPFLAVGCANIGLARWESVAEQLHHGMKWAALAPVDNISQRYGLTGFAALFAHEGQLERALELLSLAVNHPLSPPWWVEREPLTIKLIAQLQGALTPQAYADAWARGAALDLDAVTRELVNDEPDNQT